MALSMQVLYPAGEGITFDLDYYRDTHMALVHQHMGPHIDQVIVTEGKAGGPGVPAGYHAIATMTFADKPAFDAAMQAAGPVMADLPNFYSTEPQMLIGKVIG